MSPGAAALEVQLSHRLGSFCLDVELSAEGGITVLFGHSGSGKSVTLRCIAGLMRPGSGSIRLDGSPLFDSTLGLSVPAHRRRIGIVLQNGALLPHLTVRQNVGFGLAGIPRAEAGARISHLLRLLGLHGFDDRLPRTLSGGQQQRVALARALATDARLLLLDEPFNALDESLRSELRRELLRLKSELGLTILFVTHDLREAHLLADRIAVFDEGRVLQLAPRDDVFRRPASRRVAELTGVANIWPGTVLAVEHSSVEVECSGLRLTAPPAPSLRPGDPIHAVVRAERVVLRRDAPPATPNTFGALVAEEFAYGSSHILHLSPDPAGPPVEVELAARPYEVLDVANRKVWTLEIPPADIHLVPGD